MKRFSDKKGCRTEVIYDPEAQAFGYRAEPIPFPFDPSQVTPAADPAPVSASLPPAVDTTVKAAPHIRSRRRDGFTLASRRL